MEVWTVDRANVLRTAERLLSVYLGASKPNDFSATIQVAVIGNRGFVYSVTGKEVIIHLREFFIAAKILGIDILEEEMIPGVAIAVKRECKRLGVPFEITHFVRHPAGMGQDLPWVVITLPDDWHG